MGVYWSAWTVIYLAVSFLTKRWDMTWIIWPVAGVGCGLLVFIIRKYNPSYPESISYAVLVMNLATPLIDRFTRPRIYGEAKKHA